MDTFSQGGGVDGPPEIAHHDPVRCLGSGGQGQVWLMAPHDGSAPVAAKFVGPPGAPESGSSNGDPPRHNESYITQEWRLLTHFRHEHLIPLHHLVRDARGGQVLLMEHAAGGSLAQIVRERGPLSVGETVTVLTPMGQVLAFLHGRGAVNGDVAPGNILLSAAGKPFLADFGFARMLGQEHEVASGTPGFYCPVDTERTDASDVYALASVGWFLLTGRPAPPTRERLPLSTFVPDVPAELVAALEAGLLDDAVQRPSAAAFAQAVFRSAKALPVALGNAVHPSVLPELMTRHDVHSKAERKRARFLSFGWIRPLSRPAWRRAALEPRPGSERAMMWESKLGTVRRTKNRRAWVNGMIAIVAAVVLGGALLTVTTLRGAARVESEPIDAGVVKLAGDENYSMEWAVGLPSEITKGLTDRDPVTALQALAWTRSYALSNADEKLLDRINAPGSAALAADRAIAENLKEQGHSLSGLDIRISDASSDALESLRTGGDSGSASDPAAVAVRATITTSAFAELDGSGALVHRQAAEQLQQLKIIMIRGAERWTITEILAAG
ncbi:serine/threonine protein kinase [Arthrobacter psychrolactophilus]